MKLKQNYAPFPLGLKSPLHLQAPGVCKEHAGQSLGTALVVEPLPEQECSPAVEGRWHFSVSHRGTA